MSKMSMIHAELMEQCARLGFQDLGEAEQAGYGVDWQNAKLIKVEDEQEKAHKTWLKERDEVLEWLEEAKVHNNENCGSMYINRALERAIEFIKKGEV